MEEATDKLVIHHHVYNLMDYPQLELLILAVAAVVVHTLAHPLIPVSYTHLRAHET